MRKLRWSTWQRILLFSLFFLAGCKETILHNLSETDVNRLLTHLDSIKIEADKTRQPDGRWSIAVAGDDSIKAIKYLNDARLFRETSNKAPNQSSVISSREDQRFQFERALSAEIENTLSSISGVLEARVHLNLPVIDPLFGEPLKGSQSSASVLLVTMGDALDKDQISGLVSGATGIAKENVSVLITTSLSDLTGNLTGDLTSDITSDPSHSVPDLELQKAPSTSKGLLTRDSLPIVIWSLVASLGVLVVVIRVRTNSERYTFTR